MTEKKRYIDASEDYDCIIRDNIEKKDYINSQIVDLVNEQEERIRELEKELQNLQTFKKILEFAEKDMEERADWQAYCEKEFEGL